MSHIQSKEEPTRRYTLSTVQFSAPDMKSMINKVLEADSAQLETLIVQLRESIMGQGGVDVTIDKTLEQVWIAGDIPKLQKLLEKVVGAQEVLLESTRGERLLMKDGKHPDKLRVIEDLKDYISGVQSKIIAFMFNVVNNQAQTIQMYQLKEASPKNEDVQFIQDSSSDSSEGDRKLKKYLGKILPAVVEKVVQQIGGQ